MYMIYPRGELIPAPDYLEVNLESDRDLEEIAARLHKPIIESFTYPKPINGKKLRHRVLFCIDGRTIYRYIDEDWYDMEGKYVGDNDDIQGSTEES
jgi:hypothetical protein